MDGYRKKYPEENDWGKSNSERRHEEKRREEQIKDEEDRERRTNAANKVPETKVRIWAGMEFGEKHFSTQIFEDNRKFIFKDEAVDLTELDCLFQNITDFVKESITRYCGSQSHALEKRDIYFKTIEDAKKAKLKIDKFLNENVSLSNKK